MSNTLVKTGLAPWESRSATVALLWAGTIFAIDSLGFLPQIGQADAWSWVFFGAGLFALLGDFYRLATPNLPNPTLWDYIWAGFLLLLGLSGVMTNVEILWALGLMSIGVVILVNTLRRD